MSSRYEQPAIGEAIPNPEHGAEPDLAGAVRKTAVFLGQRTVTRLWIGVLPDPTKCSSKVPIHISKAGDACRSLAIPNVARTLALARD